MPIQKITPFLWFATAAEDAAKFYTSIFPNSKILATTHYCPGSPGPAGSVMTVEFELDGLKFVAFNGCAVFQFTEAISFVVTCQTQVEIDALWDKLTVGGTEIQCGWLKDRFGLCWQIVPAELPKILKNPDPEKAQNVMKSMMGMKKLDIAALKRAAGIS